MSSTQSQLQSSTHPPLQPTYIFRGHTAQIHAVRFFRQNLRLLTGDADGWVVCWSLPIKRPVAVWRPHGATVLGLGAWGGDGGRVITHGRDGKLHIWQLREEDEAGLSKALPIDDAVIERRQPWLLHTLVVSAINFCSFASLWTSAGTDKERQAGDDALIIATPGVQDGSINVTSFPEERRVATVPPPKATNTGMLMAIGLYHADHKNEKLTVIGAYESGHAALFQQNATGLWECIYMHKAHLQPVLSLAIQPPAPPSTPSIKADTQIMPCFFTSSADSLIARHPLPSPLNPRPTSSDVQVQQTKHAGQQSITLRSDNLIFATAGWDGRVRVYEMRTMRELAVLKWHTEGCYAVDFAAVRSGGDGPGSPDGMERGREEGDGAENGGELVKRNMSVAEERMQKARDMRWLAAGSKDCKVSLWEVY